MSGGAALRMRKGWRARPGPRPTPVPVLCVVVPPPRSPVFHTPTPARNHGRRRVLVQQL